MTLLRTCCCCVPLRIGCYIIAVLQILSYTFGLYECKVTFDYLGPEENEDEENKEQKFRVLIMNVIRVIQSVVVITICVVVIYATSKKIAIVLKVAGCFTVVHESLQFLWYGLAFSGSRYAWAIEVVSLLVSLYFAAVWYSYGEYIEERQDAVTFVTVYDSQTNRQVMYPLTDNSLRPQPPYQPYGGERYLGASTYPSAPLYNTQAPRPYMMPGPRSGQSLGPQTSAPPASSAQANPYVMPGARSGQSLGTPQSSAQAVQRQRDIPFNVQMPTPYKPTYWSNKNQ